MNGASEPQQARPPRPLWLRLVGTTLMTLGLYGLAYVGWNIACDPIGLGGDCVPWMSDDGLLHPGASLFYGEPDARADDGTFLGYERFDAAEMNRLHPERKEGLVFTYVPGDVASTGPDVISVLSLGRFGFAAAARSAWSGRCYVSHTRIDEQNTEYGGTTGGVLDAGASCVASAAARGAPNQEGVYEIAEEIPGWAQIGWLLTATGLLITTLTRVAKFRWRRPARKWRLGRRLALAGGIVLLVMGTTTLSHAS